MKKFKNYIAVVLLFAVVLSMSACGSKKNEIKNLMTEFERSCNKLDLNAMLDCINPEIADKVRLTTGIIGMFADKDTDEVLDGLAAILLDEAPSDAKDFFSSIKITTDDVKFDGDTATAAAAVEYTVAGEKYDENAVFEYIYTDEKWYIANLSIE